MSRWYAARRCRDAETGAVAVVVACVSVVLFAFAAVVVDLGQARDVRVQLQTTADASALAATNALYTAGTPVPDVTAAVAAAKTYAAANAQVTAAQWASCTDPARPAGYLVPAGSTPCISFSPTLTRPGRVRVALPVRTTSSSFAGALRLGTPRVSAAAEADVRVDGRSPCALCVLGGGLHDIRQGDVTVTGGDIYLNGSLNIGSNGITAADPGAKILVQGSATRTGSGGTYSPTPSTGNPALIDPLRNHSWPQPPTYGRLTTTPKTDPCTQGPGIYGSWSLSGPTTCTLSPGLYVIAGGASTTWTSSGEGATLGTGVTLFFTCGTAASPRNCNPGETGASFHGSGSRRLTLSAPTSGDLWGFTIVYDRNNAATYTMAGNHLSSISGTVYMPAGTARMNGNACLAAYSTLVIVGDIVPNGDSSCLKTTYDPTKAAQTPADNLRLTK